MMFSKVEAGKHVGDNLITVKRDSLDNIKVVDKLPQLINVHREG